MSDFIIKEASRTGVIPLVGMYGKSGSGKTMSALLFMRGLIGPKGRLTLIDSESGRGSLFADIPEIGGYKVIDIEPPFSPERYQAALELAQQNSDGIVIDSLTHEHNGEGGVLDMQESELQRMAGDNYSKREACKMAAWIKPKMAHKKFVAYLLRCKIPLICCLRGEEKTHIKKGNDNKTIVSTDEFSTPLFDQRFIFELLLNFETINYDGKGGFVYPTKVTHPSIQALLPKKDEQIGVRHGEALASWCKMAGQPQKAKVNHVDNVPSNKPAAASSSMQVEFYTKLWVLLKPIRTASDKASQAYQMDEWLSKAKIITDNQESKNLTVDELKIVLEKADIALSDVTP